MSRWHSCSARVRITFRTHELSKRRSRSPTRIQRLDCVLRKRSNAHQELPFPSQTSAIRFSFFVSPIHLSNSLVRQLSLWIVSSLRVKAEWLTIAVAFSIDLRVSAHETRRSCSFWHVIATKIERVTASERKRKRKTQTPSHSQWSKPRDILPSTVAVIIVRIFFLSSSFALLFILFLARETSSSKDGEKRKKAFKLRKAIEARRRRNRAQEKDTVRGEERKLWIQQSSFAPLSKDSSTKVVGKLSRRFHQRIRQSNNGISCRE